MSNFLASTSSDDSLRASHSSAQPRSSSASSSQSEASFASDSNVWNHIWVPMLSLLSKELPAASIAKAESNILLPSQNQKSSLGSCPAQDTKLNFRPVIGILSHPGDGASGRLNNSSKASYIAASYVKFVESAGARVIPLIYNEPTDVLFKKLNLVNGVLFTGGWAKSGLYYDVAKQIFKEVLKRNDAGDHFPLYAICLGFELLTMIISEDKNILESFSATDQASTLEFMKNANIEGTVFQRFPPDLLKKLSTDCLVMQNHKYGISPGTLLKNKRLSNFFKLLTTSNDEDNKAYVSTVQANEYPVTAFQWHPEKNAFEWGLSMIPHSEEAVQVTQYVANYFISEARKSRNRPLSKLVLDTLIYNYSPTFCGKAGKGYDEVYIFSDSSRL
ncbi:unnamed protein product [Rhodiola kirilowii]